MAMADFEDERFRYKDDGSGIPIYDKINDCIILPGVDGYYAQELGTHRKLYYLHNDGTMDVYLNKKKAGTDDYIIKTNQKMTFADFKRNNMDINCEDGNSYTITNGEIAKETNYTNHSKVETIYDLDHEDVIAKKIEYLDDYKIETSYDLNNNVTGKKLQYDSGGVIYYDSNGKMYRQEGHAGIDIYTSDGRLSIDKDGNVYDYDIKYNFDTDEYEPTMVILGTCHFDDKGNAIYQKKDGSITIYNGFGELISTIDKNGNETKYDEKKDSKAIIRNGKKTFSKIKHIEYNDDAYKKILTTLNSINDKNIKNNCSEIITSINGFPDKGYSINGINSIETGINGHINLVKSLSEMTNYSLLAYKTCDESLRDGLYVLIDSLFGDNESTIAKRFKYDIRNNIDDQDKDGILEYKEETDFYTLSKTAIVKSIYVDDDGNKWYLNANNSVIGIEGKDIKLKYGGEENGDTFSVMCDENGIIKLTDSKGNPLNIFGDYNIESEQFGGNQDAFMDLGSGSFFDNEALKSIFKRYYPNATNEQITAFCNQVARTGCGYVAMTNVVFKKFEGNEKEFYDTFGYPMYELKRTGKGISLDYNYEPMTLDLYCKCVSDTNKKYRNIYNASVAYDLASGAYPNTKTFVEGYLKDNYNVSLNNLPNKLVYYGEKGYTLYNMDGSIRCPNGDGHVMIGVGETEDGKPIVSSWGKKYILELSDDPKDRKSGSLDRKIYE